MKIGLKLHHSGSGASPEHMLSWLNFAEKIGVHLLMTSDHIALTPEVLEMYPEPYFEPFTNLAWLAGQSKKIELGTSVIVVPYRHPLTTSHLVANIDQLSNGRFILGIGVGYVESEFTALNIPFKSRGKITDDYLEAMKNAWTQETVAHQSKFLSYSNIKISPKPIQKPHPPIWVGGNSIYAIKRAVIFESSWHPIEITKKWLHEKGLPLLQKISIEHNKPIPQICPRILCQVYKEKLPEDSRRLGEGSINQIHEDLKFLDSIGAKYVIFDTKRYSKTSNLHTHHREAWRNFSMIVNKSLDLENQRIR
ncbi:MAG: TIGR03619 family F420-dependent LLM class oxidoreductase [SAR202 cluster bacterium]|nr:TIGR03619 family F420-dependent LLM class oxidoreductase [SAR202 cluster bacterium]